MVKLEARVTELERESAEKESIIKQLKLMSVNDTADSDGTLASLNPAERLIRIVEQLNNVLCESSSLSDTKKAVEEVATMYADSEPDDVISLKINTAEKFVAQLRDKVWAQHGYDSEGGMRAAEFTLGDQTVAKDIRDQLQMTMNSLYSNDERLIIVAALGEDVYNREQQDKKDSLAAKTEVQATLDTIKDDASREEYVSSLKKAAQVVCTTKLVGAESSKELDDRRAGLNREERMTLFRAQAVLQILGTKVASFNH